MSIGLKPASWAYAESFVVEDEVAERARARATELGCSPVLPGTGAALRLLTRLWGIDPAHASAVALALGADVPVKLLALADEVIE